VVIEFLTFRVHPSERAAWMEVEERTWSRFLERQAGFVRKQLWVDVDDEHHVHAMIEWASLDHWKSIPADALAAVDRAMGAWHRESTCRTFAIVRNG
jgi:uncharacterized protein (TIGR03792 family)